jgi:hypothetical protein
VAQRQPQRRPASHRRPGRPVSSSHGSLTSSLRTCDAHFKSWLSLNYLAILSAHITMSNFYKRTVNKHLAHCWLILLVCPYSVTENFFWG